MFSRCVIPVLLRRSPCSSASAPWSFEVSSFFFNVRCDWSSHVASVFLSFALLCLSGFLERAIRLLVHVSPLLRRCGVFFTVLMMLTVLVSSHVNLALQCCCFLVFFICHGDWFIHMSSLCSIAIAGPTLPLGGGVLEHRCFECSPLATTCQGLRLNLSLLEKRCPSVLNILTHTENLNM